MRTSGWRFPHLGAVSGFFPRAGSARDLEHSLTRVPVKHHLYYTLPTSSGSTVLRKT
jgi:hypothetical protein